MSAAEWIAQRRELLDAATDGPWATYEAYEHRGVGIDEDEEMLFIETYGVTYAAHSPDADLIADARTSLPRALDALEAVLDLAREWEGSSPDLLPASLRPYTRSERLRAAIETALRGES